MKNKIHPSVKIGKNVVIGEDVTINEGCQIGNNCVLEGKIKIGKNNIFYNNVSILNDVIIGDSNIFYPNVVIGTPAQHRAFLESTKGAITIGNNNCIREGTTIHLPIKETSTKVGDNNFLMAYCHIAHDCIVDNYTTVGNQATLAGHVHVYSYANIGLNVTIHQYTQIGAHSMIGMGTTVLKDVLPFTIFARGKLESINLIGLQRSNIDPVDIKMIKNIYDSFNPLLFKSESNWIEKEIKQFLENSTRGYYLF